MPTGGLIAGAIAAPIVGGLIGQQQAAADRDAAMAARQQALAQFAGINTPNMTDQQLALQQLQSVGQLDPRLEQLYQQQNTGLSNIQVDPRLAASQMAALEQVGQVANQGMTDADRASLELIRRRAASEGQAKQAQIMQEMQARGQGGSGAELIARLKGAQNQADMLSTQDMQQAQMMQQARLAALQQQAAISSGLRSQEYGEKSDVQRAQDVINQFNVANQQNVGGRNVATQNQAQAGNLQNQQRIADTNTGLANQQQMANKALIQQQFNNQMGLAGAKAGQYQGLASDADKQAAQTAAMWGGIGQGVGTGLGSAYASQKKKDVTAKG